MNTNELKKRILDLLNENTDRPLGEGEIASAMKLRGKNRKKLRKWLLELIADGEIVRLRGDRYGLGEPADLVSGKLAVTRGGNGYVSGKGYEEGVFVPSAQVGTALPGDVVIVRVSQAGAGQRPEGKIIRIVERARRDIVGTLKETGRFLCVVPIDPTYRQDFYVADAGGAEIGDRVVVRFVGWENKHVSPEAEVIESLGRPDDPSVDTLSIVRHYNLSLEFPPAVWGEAEKVSALADEPGERLDLRAAHIITIDPKRARDFDDALSLTKDDEGNRVLGVHIPGSALDEEALKRGNSVYLPDRVIPMLPEQLSNYVCSLRPNEDRLAFSAFITVTPRGKVIRRRFARTIIRSKLRLTYEQAMAAIANGESAEDVPRKSVSLLKQLDRLAQQLRRSRMAKHALDLDIPETEIVMDDDGRMSGVRAVEHDRSHQLVEECMVVANEVVSAELSDRAIRHISRLHEPPSESKIEELTAELLTMGYTPGDLRKPRNLARFLKSIEDDPLGHHARIAVLKSMKRAVYSSEARGHFGLAKAFYAHFTSPIRRYPDLVVHRQLGELLATGASRMYDKPRLSLMAMQCSETEQKAEEAERSLIEIKKLRFLEQQLEEGNPLVYDGVVSKVTNFGIFVEVVDLQIDGLVHVSSISDRFVRFNRRTETLRDGSTIYRVGKRVSVAVCRVDFDARRVDFSLVK